MCQFISGVAVERDDTVTVKTLKNSDSHSEIRKKFNIADDNSSRGQRQTPVELIPVTSLTDVSGMEFRFDAERPDWWTDAMTDEATRQLFRAAKNRWDGNTLKADYLDLSSLTSIPEGVTLSAGGYLDLSSLTSIPEGVKINAQHIYYKE